MSESLADKIRRYIAMHSEWSAPKQSGLDLANEVRTLESQLADTKDRLRTQLLELNRLHRCMRESYASGRRVIMSESLVKRLRQHALPDIHDEREVLHAPLLIEAADRITKLESRLADAEDSVEAIHGLWMQCSGNLEAKEKECERLRKSLNVAVTVFHDIDPSGCSEDIYEWSESAKEILFTDSEEGL